MKYLTPALLTLVTLLLVTNVNAQTNFKPGYIVTLNGDTTKGFIDYKQWGHRNPANVTFKSAEGEEKVYLPENVNGFGIDSYEKYLSSTVSLSQGALSLGDLVNHIDSSSITKRVFLRVIVTGEKISLFAYEDALKNRCYIAEGSSAPVELLRYKYISPTDNTKIIDVDTYHHQLQRVAANYQSGDIGIGKQIQDVYYGEQDFKNIITKINGISSIKYVESKRSSTRFFVGIGVNTTEMHFTGSFFEPEGKKWSYLPEINAGFDFASNKNVAKVVIRLELNLSSSKAAFTHSSEVTAAYQPTYRAEYRYSFTRYNMTLYPQILYNFYREKNFKAYVGAGFGIYNALYTSQVSEYDQTLLGKTATVQGPLSSNLVKAALIATARAGVTSKKVQFYLAYDPPTNVFPDSLPYKLNLTSMRFGLNYSL